MLDFKEEIAKKISKAIGLDHIEIEGLLEIPKEKNMGDYALPCFRFAKELKKSPQIIASEIKEKLEENELIEKSEVVSRIFEFLHK